VIGPEHEQVRPTSGPGFSESVTFSWGDPERALFGSLRLGLAGGAMSGLALLFAEGELAASGLESGAEVTEPDWTDAEAGDLAATIEEPLAAWRASFDGDGGGFDLAFAAIGPVLHFAPDLPVARAALLEGYEQLCRVTGTVTRGDERHEIDCLGQRGHQWGAPDWEQMQLTRSVSAWLGPDRGVALAAVRPGTGKSHADEAVDAYLVLPDEDGAGVPVLVDDARLSTTYDRDGRQRRAGLELWPDQEEGAPVRAAGEVACGTSLDLGRVRLHAAFFTWRMAGATGVGRYDVLVRDG
jgi:hypothetical protein